jgi:deoxyribonuclease-4
LGGNKISNTPHQLLLCCDPIYTFLIIVIIIIPVDYGNYKFIFLYTLLGVNTMNILHFGTAGTPISSQGTDSISGVKRVRELGLSCMEMEFVRGVKMGVETADKIGRTAKEQDVILSIHAPYYINLNSRELSKVEASYRHILNSARIGAVMGATGVVFHPAYYHNDVHDAVYGIVKTHLLEIVRQLGEEGVDILLRPETTGKTAQFGTLTEIIKMSSELEGVLPCIDFAHLHAREGAYNSYKEFCQILDMIEDHLGKEELNNMHIHISGIEYGPKGEKKHLVLDQSDMDYHGLIRAWKEYNIKGTVISESPNIEEDALKLCALYQE